MQNIVKKFIESKCIRKLEMKKYCKKILRSYNNIEKILQSSNKKMVPTKLELNTRNSI